MGILDVDSTGMLANNKDWKIIDDSDKISNVIRLIVLMGTFLLQCILFLQNMILNMATWPISYENRQI